MSKLVKQYGGELAVIVIIIFSTVFTTGKFYAKTEQLRTDVDNVKLCHVQDYKENATEHSEIKDRIHALELKLTEINVELISIKSSQEKQDLKLDRILLLLSGYEFENSE